MGISFFLQAGNPLDARLIVSTAGGRFPRLDSEGRRIWIADAHRDHGKRFVVRADEKLTAFLELERAICIDLLSEQTDHNRSDSSRCCVLDVCHKGAPKFSRCDHSSQRGEYHRNQTCQQRRE